MPFQSEKQRRFLHANHPEIAQRWEKEYAHGGISNHFRKKYSLGEGPVMEETDNMDFLSSLTQEEVDQEPEKYAQLLIGLRKPDFFMGEGPNQRAYFRQPGGGSISVPWGFHASSYEQTVDFKNGGILDINESEEIISDDGNDIELTAYNAAFDEPTGVKSLFQAKDGGRIGYAQGWSPGVAAEERESRQEAREAMRGPIGGPTTETKTTPGPDPHGGDWEKGWLDPTLRPGTTEHIEAEKTDYIEIPKHKSKLGPLGNRPKMTVTLKQAKKFAEMDKYVDEILDKFTKTGAIYAGTKFIGNTMQDLIPFIGKLMPEYFPKVNLHGEVIKDQVTGSDLGWFQDDEWDHLWGKGPKDTGGGDGPKPIVKPITLEVDEDYAQGNYGYPDSDLDRIRAGQAKRAMINPDWQEQPGLAFGQQLFNSGGLANLFRVKNNQ